MFTKQKRHGANPVGVVVPAGVAHTLGSAIRQLCCPSCSDWRTAIYPTLLTLVLLSLSPDFVGPPKPVTSQPQLAFMATSDGRVRLVGPNFIATAEQIITRDNGRGWELVGRAGLELNPGDGAAAAQYAGKRIIYLADQKRFTVFGTEAK